MNVELGIAGLGAVSPAGVGVEALLQTGELVPELIPAFGSGKSYRVLRVNQKLERLARWQNEPRLRRASAIALFMVEAAKQALGETTPASLGIVAALGTGAVIPTRRFYEGVIKSGPRFASPNVFPETVFNSPVSHVAAVLGATGPCYSVVGDEAAWVSAISVAATWLATGTCENVLVIGAEEFDPILLDAYAAVRWLRRAGRYVPSEGAGALWLRRGDGPRKIEKIVEGFPYRNKHEARQAARELVEAASAVPTVLRTAENNWFASIEDELHRAHGFTTPPVLPYLGEAFTASAAWHTLRAVSQQPGRMLQPVWGLSHQCSALLLGVE